MTVKKILAANSLDLGRCGQPDHGLRPLFRASHERSIEPGDNSREPLEIIEEICVDSTRMETVDRDCCAFQFSGELVGEEDIGQFRLTVGFTTTVTMLKLQIIKIDVPQ